SHALNANGLIAARQGEQVFVTNASENVTYRATVGPGGTLTELERFANRGGESVAVDGNGRVYVSNGQVFVYEGDGSPLGHIEVPDRPLQILFGGRDLRTLYILTHHALYAAQA